MAGQKKAQAWIGWLVFFGCLAVAFGLGLFIATIMERRGEGLSLMGKRDAGVSPNEPDSEKWGKEFPDQYASWLLTKRTAPEEKRTRWGGPDKFSWLKEFERGMRGEEEQYGPPFSLSYVWIPYAFSADYNEDRGHAWTIVDITETGRREAFRKVKGKSFPGTCMTCKSSAVPGMMKIGEPGEAEAIKAFYASTLDKHIETITNMGGHPVGCADCHDSKTMEPRISRPALREALGYLKEQGVISDPPSRQDMRSLVCAQCHSEYYFKEDPKAYLTFPWKFGLSVEAMEKYYDEVYDKPFADWTHKESKARMIKMQHPDYEMYTTGIHAYRKVACADCHMPYKSEGGVKYTDHYIQSPLKNISNSCAVCHRWSEKEVKTRVEGMQTKTFRLLRKSGKRIEQAHREIAAAMKAKNVPEEKLEKARSLVRSAQLRWDYVSANNGMGFHSPQESARILADAIELAEESRLVLAKNTKSPEPSEPGG